MNRRRFLGTLGAGLWAGSGAGFLRLAGGTRGIDGERLVERWSWVMGQPARILLFCSEESAGLEAAAGAFAELRRVEAALSLYDGASDLVALNQRAGGGGIRVAPELCDVLRSAETYRRETRGAFDPAVEPLMQAWGFHLPRTGAPSAGELKEAREAVAATRLVIGKDAVALSPGHARLDLGGIGVGYGLDRAGEVLRRAGLQRALLDISGDLLALGAPPGRVGWPLDIANPSGRGALRTVLLRDAALATSANTVAVVHYGAISCGHVLEPWSGQPARALRQVTVVADTAIRADAFATALLVSGRSAAGVREVSRVS
ncbi:MAG TPA: FAD:protein FMN transferase [Gemmatimonadales bacterium]|jgi:thiamine biosynthesis lipoprotein|nr:FAD:protein FMN transferase [Gemmatimonadales bacterium]